MVWCESTNKVIVVVEKLNEVTPKYCTDTYCNDEIV